MNDASAKEILYQFDMCNPESCYTKPLYGKKSAKYAILINILYWLMAIEGIILMILDRSASRIWWGLIPLFVIIYSVAVPHKRRKDYEKIHAAMEDCHFYTFYNDCVKVKGQTVEATFKYDTAEYYMEDAERFVITFPFGRAIAFDKKQCGEEKLKFFRSLVPEDNQKKSEKKNAQKLFVRFAALTLYAIFLTVTLARYVYINKYYYVSEYQNTTYESFEVCLNAGTITDVVIINDKYIEYTYTGHREDERYSTVCPGDIEQLIEKLEHANVNWKIE